MTSNPVPKPALPGDPGHVGRGGRRDEDPAVRDKLTPSATTSSEPALSEDDEEARIRAELLRWMMLLEQGESRASEVQLASKFKQALVRQWERRAKYGLLKFGRKIDHDDMVLFTRQLATMLDAGLPLLDSLETISRQAERPGLRGVSQDLVHDVRTGSSLSQAMGQFPKEFSEIYVSSIRVGETTGNLAESLSTLADHMESAQALSREVKGAMLYPIVSLVLIAGITTYLLLAVLPAFRETFEQMGSNLPALTRIMLEVSDWLKARWYVPLAGVALLVFALRFLKRRPAVRWIADFAALKAPVIGPLVTRIVLARFAQTFAALLRSGVPILKALEIAERTAGNAIIAGEVHASSIAVRDGGSLSGALHKSRVFPPMVVHMLRVGERSGALDRLLEKVSQFYGSQARATLKTLSSLITPILITVLGAVVGTILLGILLPMLELVSLAK